MSTSTVAYTCPLRSAKSSIYLVFEQVFAEFSQVGTLLMASVAWSGGADAVLL
jgi:hypothetical protein